MAKKTNEQFVKEIYELVGDEYTFLEEYAGTDTPIMVRHNTCGRVYKTRPSYMLNKGSGCSECAAKARGRRSRKTHDEFCQEVFDLVKDEYSVIGRYELSTKKVKMRHNLCGFEFSMLSSNFIHAGQRCPRCGAISSTKSQTKTHDEFIQEVKELVGDEYSVVSEYVKSQEKVAMKHNECGLTYEVTPNNFLNNQKRCPECARISAGINRRVTKEAYVKQLYDKFGDEYEVIKFERMKKKTLVKHNVCGLSHNYHPYDLLNGTTCVYCGKMFHKSHDYFVEEVEELVGDEYSVLSEYLGANDYVLMRHNKCGHEWDIWPANFLIGKRCPVCRSSRGELAIYNWLNSNNITSIHQHSFEGCRDERPLRFDFYIPGLNLLIEYDGEQHFEPVDFAGKGEKWANKKYASTIRKDNIKNQYCKDNNIPLLRIAYWDYENIENILDDYILTGRGGDR